MRLTSKGRYAVRAMLDLTFNSNGNPVRLQEISTRQAISLHYLEQLFRKLRTGRVVKSVRGPGGGYVLARSMDEITVKDVLECVGENINPAKDISGNPSSGVEVKSQDGITEKVSTTEFNLTRGFFENLGVIMQEYLSTTTLGDLQRKGKEANAQSEATTITASPIETAMNNEATSVIRPNIGEINQ
jgi:Rrf2 family iron-sulfur cluster assembly transcriptional regulator